MDSASATAPLTPPTQASPTPPRPPRVSLRATINTVVALMAGLFVLAALGLQVHNTREAVREEIVASNKVASQLLGRVASVLQLGGPSAMLGFVQHLGRVRANEITLINPAGAVLYRSPPATYKQGRNAPAWFVAQVAPDVPPTVLEVAGGRLVVQPNPSRAIVDGWDALVRLAWTGALGLALLLLAVFALVRRTLSPLQRIEAALARMREGDWGHRLPALPGREAAVIGEAVNRLGEAVQGHLVAQQRRLAAEQAAARNRDWALATQAQIDAERREIARELHDEFGQSVTGIRALARSLALRLPPGDATGQQAVALIEQEAARLYSAMHGLIPRLAPLTLGPLGLPDALADLLATLRQHHGEAGWRFVLQADVPQPVAGPIAQVAFRVVQEALNNAIKHSGGRLAQVTVRAGEGLLHLSVHDDGAGAPSSQPAEPPADPRSPPFGLAGLAARCEALGGHCRFTASATGGRLEASLPLHLPADGSAAHNPAP